MECDFNLLCYGLFKIPKVVFILKAFLSIIIIIIILNLIFFICLMASWLETKNGKKITFNII
jgi:hypothetical protein